MIGAGVRWEKDAEVRFEALKYGPRGDVDSCNSMTRI